MITGKCTCGKVLRIRDDAAGKSVLCPGCGQVLRVPGTTTPVTSPGTAPGRLPVTSPPPLPVRAPAAASPKDLPSIEFSSETEGLVGPKPGRRRWVLPAALTAGMFALATVLLAWFLVPRNRLPVAGDGAFQAEPAPLPKPPEQIRGDVPVKVVSARLSQDSENIPGFTGNLRVWSLRLVLENTGSEDLVLGNYCGLFESNSDGTSYEGMVQLRPEAGQESSCLLGSGSWTDFFRRFGVGNFQENDEDNQAVRSLRGSIVTITLVSSGDVPRRPNPSFGTLVSGRRCVLCLDFKLGTVLRDEFLSMVHYVSPVIYSPKAKAGPASVVVCEFKAGSPQGDGNKQPWTTVRSALMPLDFDTLAAKIRDNRAPAAMRAVAVNLLADLHHQRACETLRTRLPLASEAGGEVRAAAILALGRLKDAAAVEPLGRLVSDPSQPIGIRRVAVSALGEIDDAKAIGPVTAAARDSDKNLAIDSLTALGKMTHDESLAALVQLLGDEKYANADAAAKALAGYKERTVAPLARAVADGRADVALAAVRALGDLLKPEQPAPNLNLSDEEARQRKARQLREQVPAVAGVPADAAFEALTRALADSRSNVAEAAAETLGGVPGRQATEILLRALAVETGPTVKIIEAIAPRREPRAEDRLIELASGSGKKDAKVRSAAVAALGDLKSEKARLSLGRVLSERSEDDSLRRAALESLKKLPAGPDESILAKIAGDAKDPLRWQCLELAAKSSSAHSQAMVRAALAETDTENKWRRENLQKAADATAKAAGRSPADRLTSPNAEDRSKAIDEIAENKDKSALPALKKALAAENDRTVLWRMNRALRALECKDRDLVPILIAKLQAKPPTPSDSDPTLPAAAMLRYFTGLQNGPYESETDAERAEDVAAWAAWK